MERVCGWVLVCCVFGWVRACVCVCVCPSCTAAFDLRAHLAAGAEGEDKAAASAAASGATPELPQQQKLKEALRDATLKFVAGLDLTDSAQAELYAAQMKGLKVRCCTCSACCGGALLLHCSLAVALLLHCSLAIALLLHCSLAVALLLHCCCTAVALQSCCCTAVALQSCALRRWAGRHAARQAAVVMNVRMQGQRHS